MLNFLFFVLLLVIGILPVSTILSIELITYLMKKGFTVDEDSYEDSVDKFFDYNNSLHKGQHALSKCLFIILIVHFLQTL